ncbi:hypothetical protein HMPREF9575_01859 [Cutibacterium acnes HL110PA1]|nr:hypothetical protein HMPREF9575_01859 [Cutibacterium acnes HL110PA1]
MGFPHDTATGRLSPETAQLKLLQQSSSTGMQNRSRKPQLTLPRHDHYN